MRIIQKWSYVCAKHLTDAINENHQKRTIYYYGFYIIFGALVKGLFLVSAALILGVLLPTIIVLLVFGSLRTFAGGYHMDSFNSCMVVSMIIYLTGALVAQHTSIYWNFTELILLITTTLIYGLYVLFKYAPKDSPNKPITNPRERKRLKKISIVYLFVLIVIMLITMFMGLKIYCISIGIAIIFELFTVTPTGHKFFDKVKIIFNYKVFFK